jgi:hypothetical protein
VALEWCGDKRGLFITYECLLDPHRQRVQHLGPDFRVLASGVRGYMKRRFFVSGRAALPLRARLLFIQQLRSLEDNKRFLLRFGENAGWWRGRNGRDGYVKSGNAR